MALRKVNTEIAAPSPGPNKVAAKKSSVVATPAVPKPPVVSSRKTAPVRRAPPAQNANVVEAAKSERRVRASFSIPEPQFVALGELKARCLRLGMSAKKGEVLAAGLQLLQDLPEPAFEALLLLHVRPAQLENNGKMRKKT